MRPTRERRVHPRHPAVYEVKVVTAEDLVTFSRALDVSRGGILLVPEPRLPVGETVGLVVFLADSGAHSRIVTRGRVVRSDRRGNAITFLQDLEPAALAALVRLLDGPDPGD